MSTKAFEVTGKDDTLKGNRTALDVQFSDIFLPEEINTDIFLSCLLMKVPGIEIDKFVGAEVDTKNCRTREVLEFSNSEIMEIFSSEHELADAMFKGHELNSWKLEFHYKGDEFLVIGSSVRERDETPSFRLIGPTNGKANPLEICNEMAKNSYFYHNYNPEMVQVFRRRFHMTMERTVRQIQKFMRHKDIAAEFFACLQDDGSFTFPSAGITVEGYTAQDLFRKYVLSELGAYNYLIFLREKRSAALEALAKNVRRR